MSAPWFVAPLLAKSATIDSSIRRIFFLEGYDRLPQCACAVQYLTRADKTRLVNVLSGSFMFLFPAMAIAQLGNTSPTPAVRQRLQCPTLI